MTSTWKADGPALFDETESQGQRGMISELFHASLHLFPDLLKHLHGKKNDDSLLVQQFQSDYAAFGLWGKSYGASSDTIDEALMGHEDFREDLLFTLLQILESLKVGLHVEDAPRPTNSREIDGLVEKGKWLLENSLVPFLSSDNILDVLEGISTGVTALDDLGLCLSSLPAGYATDLEVAKDPEETQVKEEFFFELLQHRFPAAHVNTIRQHAQANHDRFARLKEIRSGSPEPEERFEAGFKPAPGSVFRDSALGSSRASKSSYAASIMTLSRQQKYEDVLPKLPVDIEQSMPFNCDLCEQSVTFTTNLDWNKHVLEDLRPWVCVYHDCKLASMLFETRSSWVAHLQTHLQTFLEYDSSCPLCSEKLGVHTSEVVAHVEQHLLEIAIIIIPKDFETCDGPDVKQPDTGTSHRETDLQKGTSGENPTFNHSSPIHSTPTPHIDFLTGTNTIGDTGMSPHYALKHILQNTAYHENDDLPGFGPSNRSDRSLSPQECDGNITTAQSSFQDEPKISREPKPPPIDVSPFRPNLSIRPDTRSAYDHHEQEEPETNSLKSRLLVFDSTNDVISPPPRIKVTPASSEGPCPVTGCGRICKDLKAHMLTHQDEHPHKCPISTCEYHIKGFARTYDKDRHALEHYKATMVCLFCPGAGTPIEETFNRVNVFKEHLKSVHGVVEKLRTRKSTSMPHVESSAKCSMCNAPFQNAQDFFEHLDDCVLRRVPQDISEKALDSYDTFSFITKKDLEGAIRHRLIPGDG